MRRAGAENNCAYAHRGDRASIALLAIKDLVTPGTKRSSHPPVCGSRRHEPLTCACAAFEHAASVTIAVSCGQYHQRAQRAGLGHEFDDVLESRSQTAVDVIMIVHSRMVGRDDGAGVQEKGTSTVTSEVLCKWGGRRGRVAGVELGRVGPHFCGGRTQA